MKSSQFIDSASFVDPSSLSLPSPPSEAPSPASPAIDPSLVPVQSSSSSISRKRARTDATPEERREARAHRNRIAAQNSRDRRKQQFHELEDKVRVLQQENDQLRAQLQLEKERRSGTVKDRENAELKERVKSLEQGWEAVLKALQTQGLPSSLFSNPPKEESTPSTNDPTPPQPPTTTFPKFPTNVSTEFQRAHSPPSTGGDRRSQSGVPAAGGPAQNAFSALDLDLGALSPIDGAGPDIIEIPKEEDPRIEDWFNEVLASHDHVAADDTISISTSSAVDGPSSGPNEGKSSALGDVNSFDFTPGSMGKSGEDMEMEQLLNLLPVSKNDFQTILGSVTDEGEGTTPGSMAEEAWSWDFPQSSAVIV